MQTSSREFYVKLSSDCVSNGNGINQEVVNNLAAGILDFSIAEDLDANVITGGAVASGEHNLKEMGIDTSEMPKRILATNGIDEVGAAWKQAFKVSQTATGLVLLTHREIDDLGDHKRKIPGEGDAIKRLHAQLRAAKMIPIFDQNDAIAVDDADNELAKFHGGGDNDWLATHLAIHLGARAVFFLTSDVPGVLVDGKVKKKIHVDEIDGLESHFAEAKDGGTGTIRSKAEAAGALAINGTKAFIGHYEASLSDIYANRSGTQVIQ
jgi:glutamate 5-kinase